MRGLVVGVVAMVLLAAAYQHVGLKVSLGVLIVGLVGGAARWAFHELFGYGTRSTRRGPPP